MTSGFAPSVAPVMPLPAAHKSPAFSSLLSSPLLIHLIWRSSSSSSSSSIVCGAGARMGGSLGCFGPRVTRCTDEDSSSSSSSSSAVVVVPNGSARSFAFSELLLATGYWNNANFLGEGGFGRVHKGTISVTNAQGGVSEAQTVAVKRLNPDGKQGEKEFLVEVDMLTVLTHPNLVKLVGYCAQGDQRMLVYEYMPLGSLDAHLFDVTFGKRPLDWNTRVKIALGVAEGLAYLHNVADPPIIFRDMKAANILLDEDFSPKLSDFGLAKVGPAGDKTHVSTRVMGTRGYCAPDYLESGRLTMKSDIYSLGILLLEMITGRKVFDESRPKPERELLTWAKPFMDDMNLLHMLADPALLGRYPLSALNHLATISAMCVRPQPHYRPIIDEVVMALKHIASQPYVPSPSLGSLPQCRSRQPARAPFRSLCQGCTRVGRY